MKKLYLFTLSLAVALTAAAAPLKMRSSLETRVISDVEPRGTERVHNFESTAKSDVKKARNLAMKSIRKVEGDQESIEGQWVVKFVDDQFQGSTGSIITTIYVATLESDDEGEYYYFENPAGLPPMILVDGTLENTYDLDFALVAYATYQGVRYQIAQAPFYAVGDQLADVDSMTLTFDPATGELTYDAYWGVLWEMYTLDDEFFGYWTGYSVNSFEKGTGSTAPDPGVDDEDWTSIGFAKFVDGWVLPLFGIDQFENEYEVGIQQNNNKETRYRLVNPYKTGPAAVYNQSTTDGYIVFDIADPAHVTFNAVDAGFSYLGADVSEMYCYNMVTFFALYYGVGYNDVISQLGDQIPYTTYKDGVVTLDYIVDEGENWYDACFGVQDAIDGGYQWQNQLGQTVDMRCRITMPTTEDSAVSAIESEENAPARYFNLQGVEVENPAKGSIVICRQGSKSSKMVVK